MHGKCSDWGWAELLYSYKILTQQSSPNTNPDPFGDIWGCLIMLGINVKSSCHRSISFGRVPHCVKGCKRPNILLSEDIFWNRTYGTCVSINGQGFHCVDFHAIHHTYALATQDPSGLGAHSVAHGVSHTFPAIVHDNALDSEDD